MNLLAKSQRMLSWSFPKNPKSKMKAVNLSSLMVDNILQIIGWTSKDYKIQLQQVICFQNDRIPKTWKLSWRDRINSMRDKLIILTQLSSSSQAAPITQTHKFMMTRFHPMVQANWLLMNGKNKCKFNSKFKILNSNIF